MAGPREVPRIIDLHSSNRDYDTEMGLKAIAYNLMIISNNELGEKPREMMKIVIF